MALERYRPGRRGLSRTEELLDTLFPGFLPSRWTTRELGPEIDWVPTTDFVDREDHFLMRAEVPGVKKEDIDISVDGNTVRVSGEIKRESTEEEGNYYCSERSYGSFGRVFRLPSEVDEDSVEARLEEGVLEIKLPKKSKETPTLKKIEVK